MKRRRRRIIAMTLCSLMLLAAACSTGQDTSSARRIADDYIEDYTEKRFEAMLSYEMTPQMSGAINLEGIDSLWNQCEMEYGAFESIDIPGAQEEEVNGISTLSYVLTYERALLTLQVIVNSNGVIVGFYLNSTEARMIYQLPESVVSSDITIPSGNYPVKATLLEPILADSRPLIIILPGSGPIDRFGTMGPNTVYLSLASQLAERGYAVLIFDKRTYVYSGSMTEDVTIKEEYLDDFQNIFTWAQTAEGIDHENIYLAGHSLGAYLMPKFAAIASDRMAGYILLANASSPMQNLLLDQVIYLSSLDGTVSEEENDLIEHLREAKVRIDGLTSQNASAYTEADLMDTPASYWLSLSGYQPAQDIVNIKKPMLFLYGNRDYQVPVSEGDAYALALADREDVIFTVIDGLNHVMRKGEGPANSEEYFVEGPVDVEVIEAIDAFIRRD